MGIRNEVEERRKLILNKVFIKREDIEKITDLKEEKFDYGVYLQLNNLAKVDSVLRKEDIEVRYIIVARNIYNNEVFVKKDADTYYYPVENLWADICPFDDYSVLSAKRYIDRFFGGVNAGDFKKELAGKTSIKVCGAVFIAGVFYVLTQIIFPDEMQWSFPNILAKKKIWDLDKVTFVSLDEKDMAENSLRRTIHKELAIV